MDNSPYESIYVDLEQTINNRDMRNTNPKINQKIVDILTEKFKEPIYPMIMAQEFLAVSPRTLTDYVQKEKVKGFLFRNSRYFKESELQKYLDTELKDIKQ